MASPGTAWARVKPILERASYVRAVLHPRISVTGAAAAVRRRLKDREAAFLDTAERAVFSHGRSPYRPLLEAAGYDVTRLRTIVGALGLEGALRQLRQDGVYFSIEEFKGTREISRGGRTFRVDPQDFDNPLASSGLAASSGGTRSRGIKTTISLENHRMGAEHLALAASAYGLDHASFAVWLATGHGAFLWAVLALAVIGNPPARCFTQLRGWYGQGDRINATFLATFASALSRGARVPPLTHVGVGEEAKVLGWVRNESGRHLCGIFTTPSLALRLALAATHAKTALRDVTFITIGEPLTPAKLDAIETAGARAFSSLGFTEFGRATYGCARPVGSDDSHICTDAIAVIQHRRPVDRFGTELDALLFTSLRPDARKILLNVETGDYAAMDQRPCGCALESLGWTEHLRDIRSFEKLNAEGRLFFGSQLISLVEEVLPRNFGGDPTDYQLVEEEDTDGFTRMTILVHPRLGPISEEEVLHCVETALEDRSIHPGQKLTTALWKETGTIRLRRDVPIVTKAGKLMALHHLRAAPSDGRKGGQA